MLKFLKLNKFANIEVIMCIMFIIIMIIIYFNLIAIIKLIASSRVFDLNLNDSIFKNEFEYLSQIEQMNLNI